MAYNIAKVRYQKTLESGKTKNVTEQYLVDCLSKTECEARIIEELSPLYPELQVKVIGDSKISEILGNKECGRFWLVKVAFITIDEKTAKEKRTISQILVGAPDFTNAVENFNEGMKGTMTDFEIVSLAETPIKEFYQPK